MSRDYEDIPTPDMFKRVFEDSKEGAAILEYLIRRFCRPAVTKGGIDAILQTFSNDGARQVPEYIVAKINQANGVNQDEPIEGD